MESSFPQGPIVNDYVLGHGSASYETVQETGFSHGFGKFDANAQLRNINYQGKIYTANKDGVKPA